MDVVYTMDEVAKLALKCILLENEKRPELEWVRKRYEWIQEKYNLKNKTETDRFLYERMHGRSPEKDTEFLKFRYWRTGKYVSGIREQCLLFGKALEHSKEELRFMMQGYCDRSEDIYGAAESQCNRECRKRRRRCFSGICILRMHSNMLNFSLGLPELTLEKLDGQLQFFRYLGLDDLP